MVARVGLVLSHGQRTHGEEIAFTARTAQPKNQLPLPNFLVRPKHVLSATSAQIFRFLPSLGVRSP